MRSCLARVNKQLITFASHIAREVAHMGLLREEKGCKLCEWWSWKVRKVRNKRDKGMVATEFKTCLAGFGAHVRFLN